MEGYYCEFCDIELANTAEIERHLDSHPRKIENYSREIEAAQQRIDRLLEWMRDCQAESDRLLAIHEEQEA